MATWKKIVTESSADTISQDTTGNAATATELSGDVTINLTGEVTGSVTNDLTAGDTVNITTTVENLLQVSNFVPEAVVDTGESFSSNDNDTSFATTGAIIDYVADQVSLAGSGTITGVQVVGGNGLENTGTANGAAVNSGQFSDTLGVVADDGITVSSDGVKADVDGTTITLTATDGTGQISANTTGGVDNGNDNLVTGDQVYDYIQNNTTSNSGTVTSVDIATSDGLEHSGSAITTSGSFTLGIAEQGIQNVSIANPNVTIGSTTINLGAAATDLDGMTSIDGVDGGMTMEKVKSIQWDSGDVSLFTSLVNHNVTIGSNASGYGVVIAGDLTVNGTTTTVNTANVDIEDKMLKLAHNGAQSDGAESDQTIANGSGGGIQVATALNVNNDWWPEFKWTSGKGGGNTNGAGTADGLSGWSVSNGQTQANTDHPVAIMDFGNAAASGDSAGIGSFFMDSTGGNLYIRTA